MGSHPVGRRPRHRHRSGWQHTVPRMPMGRAASGRRRTRRSSIVVLILLFHATTRSRPRVGCDPALRARTVRTTGPGPHLKIPFGIERFTKVPVQRPAQMEFASAHARRRGSQFAQLTSGGSPPSRSC